MEHQHNPVSSIDVILNWIYWCVQKFLFFIIYRRLSLLSSLLNSRCKDTKFSP